MRVREDTIRRRDGSIGIYGVVEKPDFVVVVPVEDNGRLHLVEQYRYPVKGRYWELPQGSWEQEPGADPMEMARGELQEETGLDAALMTYVGHLFEACGYANQASTSSLPPVNGTVRKPGTRGTRPSDTRLCAVRSGANDPRRENQGRHDGRGARATAAKGLAVEPPVSHSGDTPRHAWFRLMRARLVEWGRPGNSARGTYEAEETMLLARPTSTLSHDTSKRLHSDHFWRALSVLDTGLVYGRYLVDAREIGPAHAHVQNNSSRHVHSICCVSPASRRQR
jgi:8-oxo-dGTP pyrophosphatase MutT (NUDIX family)